MILQEDLNCIVLKNTQYGRKYYLYYTIPRITLLNIVYKLYERILSNKLKKTIERQLCKLDLRKENRSAN